MVANYLDRQRHLLTRRTPVIIALQGVDFDQLPYKGSRLFDDRHIEAMVLAAYHVFGTAPCKLAYICGDEASFVLTDYDELDTMAWLDYDKAKVESVMASLMSVAYGRGLRLMGLKDLPVFGALAFNIPEAEVANYFLWRRKHWESESAVAFGHRLLDAKQDKSTLEKGYPWDWLPENVKCGTFLTCSTHEIAEHVSVPARYAEIAELWDTVRPKDLQPTMKTARATRSGGRSRATSGGASKPGRGGSSDGVAATGTLRKRPATKPLTTSSGIVVTSSRKRSTSHSTAKSSAEPRLPDGTPIEIGKEYEYLGSPVKALDFNGQPTSEYAEVVIETRFGSITIVAASALAPWKK
jgi:hypothetical protein